MRLHLHLLVLSLSTLALGAPLAGCGDDGGGTPIDAGAIDADPEAFNRCTRANATDATAAGAARTITTPGFAYTPPCLRIKVGQTVTWNSDFGFHPLGGGRVVGGAPMLEAGSPITSTSSGNTKTVTFTAAGAFGFFCMVHTDMQGVIYVET